MFISENVTHRKDEGSKEEQIKYQRRQKLKDLMNNMTTNNAEESPSMRVIHQSFMKRDKATEEGVGVSKLIVPEYSSFAKRAKSNMRSNP